MVDSAKKRQTRTYVFAVIAASVVALLAWAFWPRALAVDTGEVRRGPMRVTIDEEARTRVRDAYVVSAPIAGQLMRVDVEPGDRVIGGDSVIARMIPAAPSALDIRTREQARAAVAAAEAALRVARADLNSAQADRDLAQATLDRQRTLAATGVISEAALDSAEREMRTADAAVDTSTAAISMRQAELASARARLIEFSDAPAATGPAGGEDFSGGRAIPLSAPISGRILRVYQESETTVSAGQPILEIGDISNDLEIIAELLSTDAVQVKPGDHVLIDHWGGQQSLEGVIERVEPWGFTKYSALGVEEQRVNTIIRFRTPVESRSALGHGYRVEVRIVVWDDEDALIVPSSALFRADDGWAVFAVRHNRARQVPVNVVQNNGIDAAITDNLTPGTEVILYPGSGI